jgi:hypothetical protein
MSEMLNRATRGSSVADALAALGSQSIPFIVTSNPPPRDFLRHENLMRWRWQIDKAGVPSPDRLLGYYECAARQVPVYACLPDRQPAMILVCDAKRLGMLTQYEPVSSGEREWLVKDGMALKVRAFSEDNDLMDKCVAAAPRWLIAAGDANAQKALLRKRVEVRVRERLQFKIASDFLAYCIEILATEG